MSHKKTVAKKGQEVLARTLDDAKSKIGILKKIGISARHKRVPANSKNLSDKHIVIID